MPKSKKKKQDHSKSKNLAFVFSIVDVGILMIVSYSITVLNVDKIVALGVWVFITFSFAAFLWYYDRRAADIFLDSFSDG